MIHTNQRGGTILPLVTVCLVALIGFLALCIDIGVMVIARTDSQAAADAGALAGVRILDGDVANSNNKANAALGADAATKANEVLRVEPTVTSSIGSYSYDSTLQKFIHYKDTKLDGENWSAVQVEVTSNHNSFFGGIFGVTAFSSSAKATAVHRPRDICIVLDYSGSMMFGSWACWDTNDVWEGYQGTLNADPIFPEFGHWSTLSTYMQQTSPVDTSVGTLAPNNWTATTYHGPPIIKDFLYDTTNEANPAMPAYPVDPDNLANAFHSYDDPDNDWLSTDPIAQPAPSYFATQSDGAVNYDGDKWLTLVDGTTYAKTLREYLTSHSLDNSQPSDDWERTSDNASVPTSDLGYGPDFKGYSMGPAYYGKTFYIWPPDPRTPVGDPGDMNYMPGDWRQRYFNDGSHVNNREIFESDNESWGGANIDYVEILKWIKSGPQVFPPNLRAGRVLYYTSIPDDVNTGSGTTQERLDKRFWREYIEFAVGDVSDSDREGTGYGLQTNAWNGAISVELNGKPSGAYMDYDDVPPSPRLQFWFGPLSMLAYLAGTNRDYGKNWFPGTAHEAQAWQLRAGINSALSDIEKNHPNDWVSSIYFSSLNAYNTPRVELGKDYPTLKNVLFFPYSLRNNLSDRTQEVRPFNSSWNYGSSTGNLARGEIPNSYGGTAPEMALKLAYNQFSTFGTFKGRKGASKVVIFETDGLPNTTGNGTFVDGGPYSSRYTGVSTGSGMGENNSTVVNRVLSVVRKIAASDTDTSDPDYPGYDGKVHAIGFGDVLEAGDARADAAKDFLLQVQIAGGTSASGDTSIESYKLITGSYTQRIDKLRDALERIMQSGIQVTLIKGSGEY